MDSFTAILLFSKKQPITAGRRRKYHGINADFCTGKIGYDTIGSDDILWAVPVGIFSRQCGNEDGQWYLSRDGPAENEIILM